MRHIFSKDVKLVAGQTSPEDLLTTADYPASGSYIEVAGHEWVNVVIHLGAINAGDTPTFKLQQATATNGTLATIDTVNCKKVAAHTDDDQALMMFLETSQLTATYHYISVDVSAVSNASYGDILFFLGGARHKPVTQATALVPTDNQFIKAG